MGFNLGRHGIVFLLALGVTLWKFSKNSHHFFPNQNGGSGLFDNPLSRSGDGFENSGVSHDWSLVKATFKKKFAPFAHEIEIYDSRSDAGMGGRILTVVKRPAAAFCNGSCNSLASPPVVLATVHEKYGNEGLYGDVPVSMRESHVPGRRGGKNVGPLPRHPRSVAEKRKQRMAKLNRKKPRTYNDRSLSSHGSRSILLSFFEWMLHPFSPGYEYGYSELDEVQTSAQYDREISQYNQRHFHDVGLNKVGGRNVPKGHSAERSSGSARGQYHDLGGTSRSRRNFDGSWREAERNRILLSLQLHVHLVNVTCTSEEEQFSHTPSHFQGTAPDLGTNTKVDSLEDDHDASQPIRDPPKKTTRRSFTDRGQQQLASYMFVINNDGHRHSNLEAMRSQEIEIPVGNVVLPECVDIHAQWVHVSQADTQLQILKPLFLRPTSPYLPSGSDATPSVQPMYLETEIAQVLRDLLIDIHRLSIAEILDPIGNRLTLAHEDAMEVHDLEKEVEGGEMPSDAANSTVSPDASMDDRSESGVDPVSDMGVDMGVDMNVGASEPKREDPIDAADSDPVPVLSVKDGVDVEPAVEEVNHDVSSVWREDEDLLLVQDANKDDGLPLLGDTAQSEAVEPQSTEKLEL